MLAGIHRGRSCGVLWAGLAMLPGEWVPFCIAKRRPWRQLHATSRHATSGVIAFKYGGVAS